MISKEVKLKRSRVKDLEYYLSRTEVDENGCLIWTKCFSSVGYPRVVIDGYTNGKAHREVFFLINGFYPEVVRHTCDNIKCINPDHLLAGSVLDNVMDRNTRGRTGGHVSQENVQEVKSLRESGLTYLQISLTLDIHIKRVEYIMNTYVKESEG